MIPSHLPLSSLLGVFSRDFQIFLFVLLHLFIEWRTDYRHYGLDPPKPGLLEDWHLSLIIVSIHIWWWWWHDIWSCAYMIVAPPIAIKKRCTQWWHRGFTIQQVANVVENYGICGGAAIGSARRHARAQLLVMFGWCKKWILSLSPISFKSVP